MTHSEASTLTFRQRLTLAVLDRRLWGTVAAAMLGAAVVLALIVLQRENVRLRSELDCRSRINAEVSQADGDVAVAIFDGLVATAEGDRAALARAAEDGREARGRLKSALDQRASSEDRCAER